MSPRSLVKLLFVAGQLALVTLVLGQFQIESGAFQTVAVIAFGGFLVHHFLPKAVKLPFFTLLSVGATAWILGIGNAAWVFGIGVALIAICHIPVAFGARLGLVLAAGAVLVVLRAAWFDKWVPTPWSVAVWPVLGSMFMFRMWIYWYDLRHSKKPAGLWRSLAYFFMLPNVCFPLFPVIDFTHFRRNWFNKEDPFAIYQKGVDWIVRGVVHLVLYRAVYYYLTLAPAEVTGPKTLVQYLVTTFLLYLRVSGQFHMIVGILHLFGWNLPETNHRYLLASSFTDFWRRINIYWKDFMMKVFYYPLFFKLRKIGQTRALVAATLVTFVITWALHSYQVFWLQGSFPVVWQDVVYWGVLGGIVAFGAVREMSKGTAANWDKPPKNAKGRAILVAKTLGTFVLVIVLWSLWTAESLSDWFALWTPLLSPGADEGSWWPFAFVAIVLFGGFVPIRRSAAATVATLAVLTAFSVPGIYGKLGTDTVNFVNSMRSSKLSRIDAEKLERGYYENLMNVSRFNDPLTEVYRNRPGAWFDIASTGLERETGRFVGKVLAPSSRAATTHGDVTTNRWGLRDRDYEDVAPPGTWRIAVMGASRTMGWGVADDETFENVLEDRLNANPIAGGPERYQLLNFSTPGRVAPQIRAALDEVWPFEPDAALYVGQGNALRRSALFLYQARQRGIEIPYPPLREILDEAGVTADMSEAEAVRALTPLRERILGAVYADFVRACRERGVVPIWVFWPQTYSGRWQDDVPVMRDLAADAGFVLVDLSGLYDGYAPAELWLDPSDKHPNALGHRLLSERLDAVFRERADELFATVGAPHLDDVLPSDDPADGGEP